MAERRPDPTVLVAADLRDLRERYVDGLDAAYDVVTAGTADGVWRALSDDVDAAVLDAALFDAPASTVAADARADYDCRVAVSSAGGVEGRAVDASLAKPVSEAALRETVGRLVARRAYVRAVASLHDACERRRERLEAGDDAAGATADVDEQLARADAVAADLDSADFRAVFDDLA